MTAVCFESMRLVCGCTAEICVDEVPPPRQRIRSVAPELGTVLEIRPEERSIDASAPRAGAHPQLQTLVETVASVDGSVRPRAPAPLPAGPHRFEPALVAPVCRWAPPVGVARPPPVFGYP